MKTLFLAFACSLLSMLTAGERRQLPEHCCMPPAPVKTCYEVDYEFYGNCLLLQPNGSDLYYAVEAVGLDPNIAVPAASPNWNTKEIDPDYQFGFEIGTSVFFRDNAMNLDLNWERLRTQDMGYYQTSNAAGFMVGPFFDIGPNSVSYKIALGETSSQFDEINLSFGKKFYFFNRLNLNFRGGVGVACIKQTLKSTFSNVDGTISRSIRTASKFIGAGPQLGVDYDCRLTENFFFVGRSDISLFMGQMKNNTLFQSYTPQLQILGIAQPNNQQTTVPDRAQLVPGFEQKLGFAYLAKFEKIKMNFEIGYQFQIYINAVQTVDMTSPQVLPAIAGITPDVGVFAVGFERTLSNYILTGPYASVGIEF